MIAEFGSQLARMGRIWAVLEPSQTVYTIRLSPQDIANGVLFLVSDDASMVHGTTPYVDGGISVTRG